MLLKVVRKLIMLLVVFIFSFSVVLTGCGGGTASSDKPVPTKGPDAGKEETGIAPFPLTGKANVPKSGKITATVWDFQKCPKEMGDMTNNVWTKWINENCPVDVKFVPITRWDESTLIRQKFASGTAPDYVFVYDSTLRASLYRDKMILRLNDLIEKNSTEYKKVVEPFWKNMMSVAATVEGDIFAFVRVEEPSLGAKCPTIRVDWLEKLGLEKPTTPEEFLEVCKAFTNNDPDGNGKDDTYGYNLAEPGPFFLEASYGIAEVGSKKWRPYIIEDGKLVIPWDRIKEFTGFMKQLYDAGVVDKDFVVDRDGSKATQDFLQGKLGIAQINNGFAADKEVTRTYLTNNPIAKQAPVPYLKTKFGQFKMGVGNNVGAVAVLNAKAKDPVAVMKYVDFCSTEKYARFVQLGVEGRHFEYKPNGRGIIRLNKELTTKEFDTISWEYRHNKHGILIKDVSNPMFTYDVKDPVERAMYLHTYETWKHVGIEQDAVDQPYPALPKELNTRESSAMKKARELIYKCVTTRSYSVDEFFKEIQNEWNKAGGPEIEKYYNDWYTKYKDRVLTKAELNKKGKLPELLPVEELEK